ncbi:hypothetical protein PIB30_013826 [Stylosanthes scabra]|uniref:Uncharacterized protein n=1 Tax=Stylosanthes scabra TaxID=79078 RepID=A0ABU6S6R4_9FABA|nr:hypothetical protein [Stylosanthes scabra]
MAGRNRGRCQAVWDPDINRLNATHHVAGALGFETPRMLTPPPPVVSSLTSHHQNVWFLILEMRVSGTR